MLILGIDTSGKNASVAVFDTDSENFLAGNSICTQKTHSQIIMPMVKNILSQAEKKLTDIEVIAVANGPGSYTGLRIGVSAVKAMSFALDCKCAGVSTLKALAYNNIACKGVICAVMSARAELVYTAVYKSDGYSLETMVQDCIMSSDELAETLALNGEPVTLCGDGSPDFFTKYRSQMFTIAPPQSRVQSAYGVCLASVSAEQVSAQELEIAYLQKVKAEKDFEEKADGR